MPPNPQNLKPPFPKGVSGNLKGRPKKGQAFDDLIAMIDKTPGAREGIAKVWLQRILKGEFQYFREYLERSDGKVPSPTEIIQTPEIDWSALDNECDTERPINRKPVDTEGVRAIPESGES